MNTYIDNLKQKYGEDNPFTLSELTDSKDNTRLRKALSDAVKRRVLSRACQGVYYFPHRTAWGTISVLPAQKIAYKLYIENSNGYYSGLSFANGEGLTSQVPAVTEITTNNASMRVRMVTINNQKYRIRKARVHLTPENIRAAAWLDYLTTANISEIEKNSGLIHTRIEEDNEEIKKLLPRYPAKTSKIFISGRFV